MRRPETIFQAHGRRTCQGDGGGKTLAVHGLIAWSEDQIAFRRREQSRVSLERAGIGAKILRRSELRRIDENRHHHAARVLFRFVDKRNMSCVKRAHGRHKPDRLARAPPPREPRPEARHVAYDLNTACGGGGHDLSLRDAFVLHPAAAVANPRRVLARTQRIKGRERAPDALIAMVDIRVGSG